MTMNNSVTIRTYRSEHRPAIRKILETIGWAEQYVAAAEQNAEIFSRDPQTFGVYVAICEERGGLIPVGFVYVQYSAWNQLAQLQGLAVDRAYQRRGIASALVRQAEAFAKAKAARGIYVDTPVDNTGGRKFYEAIGYQFAYLMPRYYEATLAGVTYQKFFVTE